MRHLLLTLGLLLACQALADSPGPEPRADWVGAEACQTCHSEEYGYVSKS